MVVTSICMRLSTAPACRFFLPFFSFSVFLFVFSDLVHDIDIAFRRYSRQLLMLVSSHLVAVREYLCDRISTLELHFLAFVF